MKVFYHNDNDGKCSAALIRKHLISKDGIDFIEMDYSKPFPLGTIGINEPVYIVDYSITTHEMDVLLKITKDVVWIDHHVSAIEKYKNYPHDIKGLRINGISACMLTFYYLSGISTDEAPLSVKLINDWDIWAFKYGNDTRHFQIALNAVDNHPTSYLWENLLAPGEFLAKELISDGKIMAEYRDGWAKEYCKSKGFESEFEGYRCFAMNLGLCNSEYFKSVDNGDYDILIPFSFNGEKWTYSLYSKTVDVSKIAQKYGGGGHKGASGFSSDELLLKKK